MGKRFCRIVRISKVKSSMKDFSRNPGRWLGDAEKTGAGVTNRRRHRPRCGMNTNIVLCVVVFFQMNKGLHTRQCSVALRVRVDRDVILIFFTKRHGIIYRTYSTKLTMY